MANTPEGNVEDDEGSHKSPCARMPPGTPLPNQGDDGHQPRTRLDQLRTRQRQLEETQLQPEQEHVELAQELGHRANSGPACACTGKVN